MLLTLPLSEDADHRVFSKLEFLSPIYFENVIYYVLVGSGTNMALKGLYDEQFPNDQMDFGKWILFNIPIMLINITITWLYLQWYFMGMFRPNSEEAKEYNLGIEGEQIARNVIIKRYKEMGPISQQEKQVAAIFLLSVVLLFTRSPSNCMP